MQNVKRNSINTKTVILNAAEELFAEFGFSGTSISMISTASRYNKSLIFQYFGDKVGLYNAVLTRLRENQGKKMVELLEQFSNQPVNTKKQARIFLETFTTSYFEILMRAPNLQSILAWEMAEGWRNFNTLPETAIEREFKRYMNSFVEKLNASGRINPNIQLEVALISITGLCLAYLKMIPRYAGESQSPPEKTLLEARSQIVSMVLDGVLS